jgi:sugar fermentation stimulation protein A
LDSAVPKEATPIFRFPAPLKRGVIVSRPNRFVMFVKAGNRVLRCHCPTTGRLGDFELKGLPCLYSTATNKKRKTAHTVDAISTSIDPPSWIGINQTAANRYIEFFLTQGALSLMASGSVKREVKLGKSRIDFLVGDVYVEVKTLLIMLPGPATIPRVKQSRFDSFGRLIRHMDELRRSLATGKRAVIILCYLYNAKPFEPPREDKTNSKILTAARAAESAGVERWQVNLKVDPEGVTLISYFKSRPYQ